MEGEREGGSQPPAKKPKQQQQARMKSYFQPAATPSTATKHYGTTGTNLPPSSKTEHQPSSSPQTQHIPTHKARQPSVQPPTTGQKHYGTLGASLQPPVKPEHQPSSVPQTRRKQPTRQPAPTTEKHYGTLGTHQPASHPSQLPTVVNVKKQQLTKRGYKDFLSWASVPGHLYIARSMECYVPGTKASKWANPFSVKQYGRAGCMAKYEEHARAKLWDQLDELGGVGELGCWCVPEACHGQVLVRLMKEKKREMEEKKEEMEEKKRKMGEEKRKMGEAGKGEGSSGEHARAEGAGDPGMGD